MFFGFDPFSILGVNQQVPVRQNLNQQPNNNIFNQFANILANGFMNPHNPPPQRAAQPPPYYRPKKKQQQPKQKTKQQPVYTQNTGNYWKIKGNQCFKKGDYQGALKMYDKAIELNNTQSVFFSNRARVLKKMHKFQQALQDAQISVELDSLNIKAHLICGQVLAEIGKKKYDFRKIQTAITRLTKALTLCANQNKNQYQKELITYIYRAKKVLWFMKFNQIRQNRICAINEYKDYLQTDRQLSAQQKQLKLELFMQSINESVSFQIPDYLICNITLDMMQDPVTTQSGQTYQRTAIQQHIQRNGKTDPFTRKPISGQFYPNLAVRKAIEDFLGKNPWAYEYSEGESIQDVVF